MTRSQFLKRTLGAVLVSVGLSKVAKAENDKFDLRWTGEPMNSPVEANPSLNGKYKMNYMQNFRDHYRVNDGEVSFQQGIFKTSDPELAKALFNHPMCKK